MDPASHLPTDECRAFHEEVRAGNVDGMLELLELEPRLVHARNEDRATSLMVAAVHPNASRAIQMVDLLMDRGAYLGSHDSHRRSALIFACQRGIDPTVIDRLFQWNTVRGGTKFTWFNCDDRGRSALVLASMEQHTAVATLLLDRIDIKRYSRCNIPLKILQAAIDSGNEQHALEIAGHQQIRTTLEDPERTRYKGSGRPYLAYTLSTCTEAAVERGMVDLVQVMNQFNWRKVSRAVWYKIREFSRQGVEIQTTVPPVFLTIGKQFTNDWRWTHVRGLFLARYYGLVEKPGTGSELQKHPLGLLPDEVFARVVTFVVPEAFWHPSESVPGWCGCEKDSVRSECR
ncbi:hypothetical protein BBJ28_00002012 [Nothophytophthora sp. Chile5]|nr:hypothetical protein BBJ28_00002012 [Nothophytophthora sp. Chile5]